MLALAIGEKVFWNKSFLATEAYGAAILNISSDGLFLASSQEFERL